MSEISTIPWEQPGWQEEARAWILSVLSSQDLSLAGSIDQPHIRPWSTVLRVPTSTGLCFFKASAPHLRFEPALTGFLANLRPDISPDLLGTDLERGWMLMRSSGQPLRSSIRSEKSLARWRDILPLFCGLQQEMIPHSPEILALGVFDRRPVQLPRQFESLIANRPAMQISQSDGLTEQEYTRLLSSVQPFEKMCAELASFPIPATLHHDDFHDGNLFLQDGRVIFTDWAESAVAHPFFSLVVMLRGAENSLDLEPEDPQLDEMREWYLSGWSDFLPLTELRRVAHLAEQIGLVNRALTWQHLVSHMPVQLQPEYALAVPSYLQDFLNVL